MSTTGWRKSSHSIADGNCVEAGKSRDGIVVRDSVDSSGKLITYNVNSWRAFVVHVKEGEFDPRLQLCPVEVQV